MLSTWTWTGRAVAVASGLSVSSPGWALDLAGTVRPGYVCGPTVQELHDTTVLLLVPLFMAEKDAMANP